MTFDLSESSMRSVVLLLDRHRTECYSQPLSVDSYDHRPPLPFVRLGSVDDRDFPYGTETYKGSSS